MPAYVFDKKTNELVKVAGNAANADLKDMNVYSTEEKIVGTWIDGKPIYRKVLLCTKDTAIGYVGNGGWTSVSGWTVASPNIKEYVNVNTPISSGNRIDHNIKTDKSLDFYSLSGPRTIKVENPLILEYTKTTD